MSGSFWVVFGFTIVANGQIHPVPSQGAGKNLWVSGEAVATLAKSGGASVTTDPGAGVISVSTTSAAGPAKFKGFKGTRVTFVVDGQIIPAQAKIVKGTPYVKPGVLKQVATKLGWSSTLDAGAGVMAVTQVPLGGAGGAGASGGGGGTLPYVAPGLTPPGLGGTPGSGASSGGGVCSYMNSLKKVWDGTEPSKLEKVTFQRLASDFQAVINGEMEANDEDLDTLKKAHASFSAKVDRRISGTKRLNPPAQAMLVKTLGLSFLAKVNEVMETGEWMMEQMNVEEPEGTKEEMNAAIEKLQNLDTDIQDLGRQFNREVIRVRSRHGCGPP